MKYYSERLNRVFDSEKECLDAEFKVKQKENLEKIEKERALREEKERKEKEAAERKEMADKVEAARKEMVKAQNAYAEALKEFIDKYHTYHFSSSNPADIPTLFDIFDKFFLV